MKRKIYVLLLLCWPGLLLAQNRLAGRVTDAAGGQPLAGVNVRTVPGTQGTTTDAAGYYSLSGPARELVFSSVGYQSVTEAVAGRSEINVVLATASQNLDEVVVVGYGTQRRASVTGAVVSLPQADLLKRQVSTASNLLQGLAAGVTVSQQSGRPGRDGANINIRGLGSIFSNSDPLVLIDNVPASLDMIDPNNIESISVLKDAASTAIFGSRAANGVATYFWGDHDTSETFSPIGELAADYVLKELVSRTGAQDLGCHQRQWNLLRSASAPTIWVDLGYLSNPVDRQNLEDPEHRERLAEALLCGLQRMYLRSRQSVATGTMNISDIEDYYNQQQP